MEALIGNSPTIPIYVGKGTTLRHVLVCTNGNNFRNKNMSESDSWTRGRNFLHPKKKTTRKLLGVYGEVSA